MAYTPTTFLNLLKAAVGEKYSVAVTNSNLDLIDANAVSNNKLPKGTIKQVIDPTTSGGLVGATVMINLVVTDLVAGRNYEATWLVDTDTTATNMAISCDLRKSVTTDNSAVGTSVTPGVTVYTAGVASSGKTLFAQFNWKATTTETVNLKMVMTRLTTTSGYNIAQRRLVIRDMGANF